jgi:hypothetical protein
LLGCRKGITDRFGGMRVYLLHRSLVYPATKDSTVEFNDFTGLATVWTVNEVTLWVNEVTLWVNEVTLKFVILGHFY